MKIQYVDFDKIVPYNGFRYYNATIVTNVMTDQVCVMNSDGIHGWIEKAGYPSETRIKKRLVDYLEGGVESFNHKIKIYQSVL